MSAADFVVLREALAFVAETAPSYALDRVDLLQRQGESIAREEFLDTAREARFRKAVLGPGKHSSGAPLSELRRVGLAGLRINEVAKGWCSSHRLAGSELTDYRQGASRTCNLPWVSSCGGALHRRGLGRSRRAAAALPLPPRDDSRGYVPHRQRLWSVSAQFDSVADSLAAVLEPNLRESSDGYVVRVEVPSDLVRLRSSSPYLVSTSFASRRETKTALQHKATGNLCFGRGEYARAKDSYAEGLDCAGPGEATTLLLNRAAALLKLDRPGAALKCCCAALQGIEPTAAAWKKAHFRAATAEYMLSRYIDAEARLDRLLADDSDPATLALMTRTRARLKESETGLYEWPSVFDLAITSPTLDIADFQGPVEIANIPGRGRGLIASRNIEIGELLLVAKPMATGRGDPKRVGAVVGANLFTETIDPYPFLDLLASLVQRCEDDPPLATRLFDLSPSYDFVTHEPFPPLDSPPRMDVSRLEGIATFNSFHVESLADKSAGRSRSAEVASYAHAPSSLYGLPSYMNHSCVGNVSYSFLADVLFLRARTKVRRGDELLDSYVDALGRYEDRTKVIERHGFVCDCELCREERADGTVVREKRRGLCEAVDQLTDKIHGDKQEGSQYLAPILHLAQELATTYDRASRSSTLQPGLYAVYRLLSQTLFSSGRADEALPFEIKALESLGARFDKSGAIDRWGLLMSPRLGDVNAVLSLLFIAKGFEGAGRRRWIEMAQTVEKGQAGIELFESRYGDWAGRHALNLSI